METEDSSMLFARFERQEYEALRDTDPEYLRWRRFAYQVVADTYSLCEQVPLRVLLPDRLVALPDRIVDVLHNADIQQILGEVLGDDREADGWRRLLSLSSAEVESRLLDVDAALRRCWLQAMQQPGKQAPDDPDRIGTLDDDFLEVLRILRPYLEAEIWLTELSNTPPLHALWRLHDIWPIYLLGWCYRNRHDLIELSATDLSGGGLAPRTFPAFDGDMLRVAVLPEFTIVAGGDVGKTITLVGPFSAVPLQEADRQSLTRQFLIFAKQARRLSARWLRHREFAPSPDELSDATYLLEPLQVSDLAHRISVIYLAWNLIHDIATPSVQLLTVERTELERISTLVMWVARLLHAVRVDGPDIEAAVRDLTSPGLSLAFVHSKYRLNVSLALDKPDLSLDLQLLPYSAEAGSQSAKSVATSFDRIAQSRIDNYWLTLPSSLLHRVRERRSSNWTDYIFAINGLLNRQLAATNNASTKWSAHQRGNELVASNASAQFEGSSWILMEFGNRLCQHLVSMTRADTVTVYWLDYSTNLPRLRHVSGYSRHFIHRARRHEIVAEFDRVTWSAQPDRREAALEGQRRSLVYRVAQTGKAEYVDPSRGDAVWSGYPGNFAPLSALAVPIVYGGRVIGVLGCNGIAPGQLSPSLVAPLRKVCQLVGPFMHSTLLLRSISELSHLIDSTPPIQWRQVRVDGQCPIDALARSLTNVLLVGSVQVWLAETDPNNFRLLATSDSRLVPTGSKAGFTVLMSERKRHERGVAELAVLHWRHSISLQALSEARQDASGDKVPEQATTLLGASLGGATGDFLQANYWPGEGKTIVPAPEDVTPGSVFELHDDFVDSKPTRRHVYRELGFRRTMAFVLPQHDRIRQTNQKTNGRHRVAGIVVAYTGSALDTATTATEVAEGGGRLEPAYGLEWQPVIQYIQEILPSVLQQAQLITSSQDRAQALVIHEAAKALGEVVAQAEKTQQQLAYVFKGPGQEFLRSIAQVPPVGVDPKTAVSTLNAIRNAAASADELASDRAHANLERVASKLKNVSSYSYLEVAPGEKPIIVDLGRDISRRIKELLPSRGAAVSQYLSIQGVHRVEVEQTLWNHLVGNLLANMVKYAEPDTYSVELRDDHLVFSNWAPYDSERDYPPDRHLQYGVRGSAAPGKPGEGFGLYIARDAAHLMGVKFVYSIVVSTTNERRARYTVDLDLHTVLVRGRLQ